MSTVETDTVQFVRHGNKLLLDIDPDIVKQLGLTEHTKLRVSSDGASLIFTPIAPVSPEFTSAMQRIHTEWADVFKKLAE